MRDATVDRLRIIVDPQPGRQPEKNRRLNQAGNILTHLRLEEGWFSFFLLAVVVYSTVWCVQAVGWVDHLGLLTPITAAGLLVGVIAAKQRRIPRILAHVLAVVLGVLVAFWQTCAADYAGQASAFIAGLHSWTLLVVNGGTSSDDSIFLLFILSLGFLLAYTSTWLLYRTRSPWLMLLANAVVLLINLNEITAGYIVFLIIFLIAAMLLLLRFNLYESSLRWRHQGLRCSEDLHWEFMQAGAFLSLAILVCSWFLPWGYINQQASLIWNANPLVTTQNLWNRLMAVNGGTTPQNHGSFANTLILSGNPNLVNTPVFQVKTSDGTQYLMSVSYDQYDGVRIWSNSSQVQVANKANTVSEDGSADLHAVTQTVTVINPPGEEYPYIFGASQIASTDQNIELEANKSDDEVVAWLRDNGKLAAGDVYTVVSYVSDASLQELRSIPMPANSPRLSPDYDGNIPLAYFDPSVLAMYTKVPVTLDTRIKNLALQITQGSSTMYDKVAALENYLRTHYTYDATINAPPSNKEAASWFLFDEKRGYCNYFATAMTLMARELGIPARVAVGYTNGTLDSKTGLRNINGTDAHAWVQVYFAGYGWINFEPSAPFPLFVRLLISANPTPITSSNGNATINSGKRHIGNESPLENGSTGNTSGLKGATNPAVQISLTVGAILLALIFCLLCGLIYFSFWWRRLFRRLSLLDQIYGRICVMAGWAGLAVRRSQTPHEYMQTLSVVAPTEAVTFERLGDIYTREHWADPQSEEHPARSGEIGEVPDIWKSLQPRLTAYVLRHPYFLKRVPNLARNLLTRLPFLHVGRIESTIVVEEELK